VVDVKAKVLPELDDDFAKALNLDSLDDVRKAIREDLSARAQQEFLSARKEEFVTKLAEGAQIDIPDALIERRRHAMEHDIEHDLERQGMKLSEYRAYLKSEGKSEEFDADLVKSAEDRVRRDLATEALAENLGVTLTDEEWKNALEAMARANRVTLSKLKDAIGEDGIENFRQAVIRDKAVETALQQLQ
ncbi:MAG TPA: trigger factor, partial [Deinococcales bacterium]|nr:trigger factor [Deinococcales bacterium]